METRINITEVLKDKPQGTKLYDLLRNIEVELDSISNTDYENIIWCRYNDVNPYDLYGYSTFGTERGWLNGLQILLPSKEMRDWSRFAWKKGDRLISSDGGTEVIFDKWYDDTYTSFYCKHYLNSEDETKFVYYEEFLCTTERYVIEDKDKAQIYIGIIEERLGGKLNCETLEIEKTMPELYDGDIAFADYGKRQDMFIVTGRTFSSDGYTSFISLDLNHMTLSLGCKTSFFKKDLCELRLATDEEKKQLFDALEKNGKRWDAKKKEVVDLKPKYEFKPFDKVLVRNYYNEVWRCDFYRTNIGDIYACIVNGNYLQCIPYNEETAKLIGTKEEYIV